VSPNSSDENKVDPRVRRTRQQLYRAFAEVVMEKGFQATSVQDIAERAGVNRTTFYLHFADKYALAEYSIAQKVREDVESHLPDIGHLTPVTLRELIHMVFVFVLEDNTRRAKVEPQFDALIEAQVRKQIQEHLQRGLPSTAQDVELTTTAASWAIYGLAQQWHHTKPRPPMERQLDRVLPLIAGILGLACTA
jgi:AcrR family transcriptional regulator